MTSESLAISDHPRKWSPWVILFAFLVNVAGNRSVGMFSLVMAAIKIGGIALFGIAALWASGRRMVSSRLV